MKKKSFRPFRRVTSVPAPALFRHNFSGMGSFAAVGGIKAGVKSVTAFETADCATALAVAKFKSFGKPGGSSYLVSAAHLLRSGVWIGGSATAFDF